MTIKGLEQNGYLINNPIILNITSDALIQRLEVSFLNMRNGKTTTLPNLFADQNNNITLNIQQVIKGLFTEPKHIEDYGTLSPVPVPNNSNKILITFKFIFLEGGENSLTLDKTFIRGGNYTYESNQNLPSNKALMTTLTLPYWSGYPFRYYSLNADYSIIRKRENGGMINEGATIEYLNEKSCNSKYLAFLNSKGGYSYYLFDNFDNESTNDHLGIVNNGFNRKDLGSEYENGFKISAKVPQRFFPIIRDLIFSPEIYEWKKETQTWKRIYSDNNKLTESGAKAVYKFELKFKDFTNYNPSLL